MKPSLIVAVLFSVAAGAAGVFPFPAGDFKPEQDVNQENAKQEDATTRDVAALQDEIATLKKQLESYKKSNQKLVSQLMRVVHREPDSPLVVFGELIEREEPEPDWRLLEAKAKLVQAMATSLQTPGTAGENYLKVATELRESTKDNDFASFKDSVKRLQASCSSCHGWAPPQ